MRQISSKMTWWYKKASPVFYFGIVALLAAGLVPAVVSGNAPVDLLFIPLVMAVVGYVMMRWLVFPLLDEVWIDGDDLVLRNRNEEERLPIANIIDVDGSSMMSPEHVGITFEPPSRFGKSIRFAAPFRLLPIGTHPLARELADFSRRD